MPTAREILNEYLPAETEDSSKIRVINKKTGKQYFIDKQNFDPEIHDRTDKVVVPKEKKDGDKGDEPEGGEGGEGKEDEKKEPAEKPVSKITPVTFISTARQESIIDKVPQSHPDVQKKIMGYDFNELLELYDGAVAKVKAGKGEYVKAAKSIGMKIQAVSLAKYAILSKNVDDEFSIGAAKGYRKNAKEINSMLRGKMPEITSASTEGIQKLINELDRHFSNKRSELETDCIVYRGSTLGAKKLLVSTKTWTDKAFVSTSLNPFIGEDFTTDDGQFTAPMRTPLFAFQLKVGDPILITPCTEDPNCNETEITLPRGGTFTIDKFDEKRNIYYVNIEFPNARI